MDSSKKCYVTSNTVRIISLDDTSDTNKIFQKYIQYSRNILNCIL